MKSKSKRGFSLAVLCAVLALACEESTKSEGGDPSTTGNAAVDEIVTAYCGALRSCCIAAGLPVGGLADCNEIVAGDEAFQEVLAGKIVLREPERSECVAWLEGLANTCVQVGESPCSRIYNGLTPEGGTCENAEECRVDSGVHACVHTGETDVVVPGACRTLSVGQLGSPCVITIESDDYSFGYGTSELNPPLAVCDRRQGLYCDYGDPSTCQPLVGAGQPCSDYDSCAAGLYCDMTCVPQLAAGSSCESFDQCATDLRCTDGTCGPRRVADADTCGGDL